jgi:hypothetical protein
MFQVTYKSSALTYFDLKSMDFYQFKFELHWLITILYSSLDSPFVSIFDETLVRVVTNSQNLSFRSIKLNLDWHDVIELEVDI